jgi:type II secretory pathway predicted ATPase ExeA
MGRWLSTTNHKGDKTVIEQFYNFKHAPFERNIPVEHLYTTPKFDELLSRLDYAARMRKFIVLTGDVGVGKTTAIRKFASMLDRKCFRCIYVADSALTPRVFYWEVLTQLSSDEKPSFYRSEGKRKIMDRFAQLAESSQVISIVIIDEAHLLSPTMLEETRFLLNIGMDSQNPMGLVIVGQSELRQKLSAEVYEPITQRIDFRFALVPFDRGQTQDYIHAHMRYAGAAKEIFSPSAVDAIFDYSGGVARKVNKACSLSLLYAAQKSMHTIDASAINFVVDQELTW